MTQAEFHSALVSHFPGAIPYANSCAMQITEIGEGCIEMRLPYRDAWLGDIERGHIHTGIITSLVDTACGSAVLSCFDTYEPVATIDLRMDYLRAALRDLDTICRAECYRLTSAIAFARAQVWQKHAGNLVATSQSVFMRASRSPGSRR